MTRTRITRRGFLLLAGGALGAAALVSRDGTLTNGAQPKVDFVEATYGEANAMNDRILVAYASQTGSTVGVAEAVGKQLAEGGATVDVRRVRDVTDLSGYRAVVVGSAIHSGRWLPEAVEFVKANQSRLSQLPTAYFLVCLMVANDTEGNRRQVATFLEPVRTLVKPVAEGRFAGYLLYDRYSLMEGLGMRVFAAIQKLGEGDYRNWDAIRAWADSTRPLLLQ